MITNKDVEFAKSSILRMLKNSQTKVIFPIMTFALLKEYSENEKDSFTESEIKVLYNKAVLFFQAYLGHRMHTGAKFYDAYPIRNLPRYNVLSVVDKTFYLSSNFKSQADDLINWIPETVKDHIDRKIGIIPRLGDLEYRITLSENITDFVGFVEQNIDKNPTNFEIFSFATIKVHLEKFACKIYRDTRTSASDKGVDLSTNYGAVYQIKQLKLMNIKAGKAIFSEINSNFDMDRINDGKIILIIDDISSEVKSFLIDMKIQPISKKEILSLLEQVSEQEDRMKILRIIYDEFKRDYESQIK